MRTCCSIWLGELNRTFDIRAGLFRFEALCDNASEAMGFESPQTWLQFRSSHFAQGDEFGVAEEGAGGPFGVFDFGFDFGAEPDDGKTEIWKSESENRWRRRQWPLCTKWRENHP